MNNIVFHKNLAWIFLILFWIAVLFNVAEYKKEPSFTANITCQNFMKEYCGIKFFMGSPFRICKLKPFDKSNDLLPLIIAAWIIFTWVALGAGKILSFFMLMQTFTIAKTNFSNDNYIISIIFYYATVSIILFIIFYKNRDKKAIYIE